MSAIVKQVFTPEEEAARFKFQQFCTTFFDIEAKSSKTFEDAIHISTLLRWYEDVIIGNPITEAEAKHILYFGGFLRTNTDEIWLSVREDRFSLLPAKAQEAIANLIVKKKQLVYHKMMYTKQTYIKGEVYCDLSVDNFYNRMVFQKAYSSIYKHLSKDENQVSIKDLYEYYIAYCIQNNYIPVSKKVLLNFLDKKKHMKHKGYHKKESGVVIYVDLFIPQKPQDIEESLSSGLAIITINEKQYFNDNRSKSAMSAAELRSYNNTRKDKYYEQKTAKERAIQEEEELLDKLGDNFKTRETDVSAGAPEEECEVYDGDSEGIIGTDEEPDTANEDDVQGYVLSSSLSERTSGVDTRDSEITDAQCGRDELGSDPAECGDDRSYDDGRDGDDVAKDPPIDREALARMERELDRENVLLSFRAAKKVLKDGFNEEFIQQSLEDMESDMTVAEVLELLK